MGMVDPTAVELLEHSRWVRELARRLARDASAADDLVQETWRTALEHPPAEAGAARRWLGAVVRNLARQARRADHRRREREERAARAEAQGSTDELVARAELERELVAVVLALDEPYRTTVLLRFFEELPPRAIARRMGVSVETVKTRLGRALARLRTRLEGARPDPRAWLILAAPLADPHAALSTALGSLLMNAKLKLSLAAAAVLGVIGLYVVLPGQSRAALTVVVGTSAPERSAEGGRPDEGSSGLPLAADEARAHGGTRREVPSVVEPSSAPQPAAAVADTWLRGRVLDESGQPLAGIPLGPDPDEADLVVDGGVLATSAADGSFRLAAPRTSIALVARDERFATILAGFIGPSSTAGETIVVVAPSVALAGRVEDEQGAPLPGARLSVEAPPGFRARFHEIMDRSRSVERTTAADEHGGFRLAGVPFVEGAILRAAYDGRASAEIPIGPASDEHLLVVLPRLGGAEDVVAGIVLDETGQPADGARVAFGLDSQRTSGDGRFEFPLEDPESFSARMGRAPDALVAVARGRMPGRYEAPRAADGARVWPRFVTLRLGLPTLSIAGRVLDDDDRPVRGAQVWLSDPSFFGAVDGDLMQLENLLAGVKASRGRWNFVTTGSDGAFAIEGLVERSYRLQAMDPETLLRSESEPVQAGSTGVRLRLPTDTLHARVAGRIVSNAGVPIAGASIYPMCDAFDTKIDGWIASTNHGKVKGTRTDDDGRFELRNVPRSLVYLRIDGEEILPLEYGRYVEGDERFEHAQVRALPTDGIDELVITVNQRAHFRVELLDPSAADSLAVLDARGVALELSVYDGDNRREGVRQPIRSGRTASIAAPDCARTLVLYRGDDEVARRVLELVPGELVQVRM